MAKKKKGRRAAGRAGNPSRDYNSVIPAVRARAERHGLDANDAESRVRDQRNKGRGTHHQGGVRLAGSAAGRLRLRGQITGASYDALMDYDRVRRRWLRAAGAPRAAAGVLGAYQPHGSIAALPTTSPTADAIAKRDYEDARAAISEWKGGGELIEGLLDETRLTGTPSDAHPDLVCLRLICRDLARWFGRYEIEHEDGVRMTPADVRWESRRRAMAAKSRMPKRQMQTPPGEAAKSEGALRQGDEAERGDGLTAIVSGPPAARSRGGSARYSSARGGQMRRAMSAPDEGRQRVWIG